VAVGVIWRRGRVLVQRRPETGLLGGLWEFPGGKRQAGEPLPETVRREVAEETGLTVRVEAAYGSLEHAYSHFSITLTAFRCTWQGGRVRRRGGATAARWVRPAALSGFAMPRANRRVLAWLGLAAAAEGAPSGPVQVPSSSVRRGSMARPLAGRRAASSRARNRS
jgi:A/G-specific adenine glycosylase